MNLINPHALFILLMALMESFGNKRPWKLRKVSSVPGISPSPVRAGLDRAGSTLTSFTLNLYLNNAEHVYINSTYFD